MGLLGVVVDLVVSTLRRSAAARQGLGVSI
jgi:hypothetical protein